MRIQSKYWIGDTLQCDRRNQEDDMYADEGLVVGRVNTVSFIEDEKSEGGTMIRYYLDDIDDWVEEPFVKGRMVLEKGGAA
jgi:hypothetical protein